MKLTNLILALVLVTNIAFAQKEDKKKSEQVVPVITYTEGVVYALPRTGISINVVARKAHYLPGPYQQYAERFLGLRGIKPQESETWEIVSLSTDLFTEADPNAIFKANTPSLIAQLPDGIISGINTAQTAGNLFVEGNDFLTPEPPLLFPFTDLSSEDFYDVMVDPATGKESFDVKTNEEKAREAAEYIIKLRKKRSYTILDANNVVPEDGKGYEVFVAEAQRLEKEYVSLFAGKIIESKHSFSFTFVPGENSVKNEVLFRFSPERGVLPKTDVSGKPVLIEIIKDENTFAALDKQKKSDNPKAGSSGVFYRIPCAASIKLTDGLTTLYSGRLTIAQFGVIAPMPELLLEGKHQILFNTQTGSIKQIQ